MKSTKSVLRLSRFWLLSAVLASALSSVAGTVVVTPGSLAGYTYFPKVESASGGAGGGSGENVSTLQRCLYAPDVGDKTVTVANDMFDHDKDLTLYYRMAGGNGGAGVSGGGGGSSAILLNGTLVSLAPGGNGGTVAQEVSGFFKIKKGDTLRFVTGGGGGDAHIGGSFTIGGGGGAGFTGGGGGASRGGSAIPISEAATASGKGGGVSPGLGGSVTGGMSGTAGLGSTGGVSTWPNGNSASVGNPSGTGATRTYTNTWSYVDWMGVTITSTIKFPAQGTVIGAPVGVFTGSGGDGRFAGGGGSLGWGGGLAFTLTPGYCNNSNAQSSVNVDSTYVNDNGPCYTFYNQWRYFRPGIAYYPPHTNDMQLTRRQREVVNNGNNPIHSVGGSFSGQIITMYQAPVCGILK